jgi:mRNA interferase MazF
MEKDFDVWNTLKKRIHQLDAQPFYFHEREIWWCSLGLNIGEEQDGKNKLFERPVLILKKFNNKVALILPLTRGGKKSRFYIPINHPALKLNSFVILSQVRLVSSKRFRRYLCKITPNQYDTILIQFIYLLRSR